MNDPQPPQACLLYHPEDKEIAQSLSGALSGSDLHAPLYELVEATDFPPFKRWVEGCKSCVLLIGKQPLTHSHVEALSSAIENVNHARNLQDQPRLRVIPTFLPDAISLSEQPLFIQQRWPFQLSTPITQTNIAYLRRSILDQRPEDENPYHWPGYFDVEHESRFFGRTVLTEKLVEFEKARRFVVAGAARSGKSSFARAGILAALKSGKVPGSFGWIQLVCTLGHDPLRTIATALCNNKELKKIPGFKATYGTADALEKNLRTNDSALHTYLTFVPLDQRVVLFLDQFEDIFAEARDKKQQSEDLTHLLKNLRYATEATTDGPLMVLCTIGAGVYGYRRLYPDVEVFLDAPQETMNPLTNEELEEVIRCPLKKRGTIEDRLVRTLIQDGREVGGDLFLLQYALTELWHHTRKAAREREGHVVNDTHLTEALYDEIGGIKGVMPKRADALYQVLEEEEKEKKEKETHICRYLFLKLIHVYGQSEVVGRSISLDDKGEVPGLEQHAPLRKRLTQASLLIERTGVQSATHSLALGHPVLYLHWDRLKQWIKDNRDALQRRDMLERRAEAWHKNGETSNHLLSEQELKDCTQLEAALLDPPSLKFLAASERFRRRKQWQRRWGWGLVTVALFLLTAAFGMVVALLPEVSFFFSKGTWKPLPGFIVGDPIFDLLDAPSVDLAGQSTPRYYLGTQSLGVYRSVDGVNWHGSRPNATGEVGPNDPIRKTPAIYRMAVDRNKPQRVLIALPNNELHLSEDAGQRWEPIGGTALPPGIMIDLDVLGETIVAVTQARRQLPQLYLSHDGGNQWETLGGAARQRMGTVWTVVIALEHDTLYLGTDTGLYASPLTVPSQWEQVVPLETPVRRMEVGSDGMFYLAAKEGTQSHIYRWHPAGTLESLTKLPGIPLALTLHPDPHQDVALYVLTNQEQNWLDNKPLYAIFSTPGPAHKLPSPPCVPDVLDKVFACPEDLMVWVHPPQVLLLVAHGEGLILYDGKGPGLANGNE